MKSPADDIKLAQMKPIRPRPAFSGFLGRIGAFILDVLALYMLGWVLNRTFRPALLHLNPFFPWLAYVFAFLYFFICEGPLGRGRTTGKYVLSMHIVTADGGFPTWKAALRRALLKTAVLLASIDPLTQTLIFPASATYTAGFVLTVFKIFAMSLAIALGLSISIHPWKRGWHDLWAGTFVTGDPTPSAFRETLDTPPDPVTARRMAMNFRMTTIFFVVATAVMMYPSIAIQLKPDSRVPYDRALVLQTAAPLTGARIVQAYYPNAENKKFFLDQIAKTRASMIARGETAPTTDSIREIALYDGESIAVQAIATDGMTTQTAMSPAMIQAADRVRANAWQIWRESESKNPSGLSARQFKVVFVEPFRFLTYNGMEIPAIIEGPADPAAGPLNPRDLTIPPALAPTPAPQPTHEPGKQQPQK